MIFLGFTLNASWPYYFLIYTNLFKRIKLLVIFFFFKHGKVFLIDKVVYDKSVENLRNAEKPRFQTFMEPEP